MREDEKKMIGLLCEINEICKDNGAGYYVIEQELLSVYRPKRSYEAEADICMLYSDFLRVKDRLSEKKAEVSQQKHDAPQKTATKSKEASL